ncbi:hypothetical protein [Marinicauda sp. Alg238-R41]|uniref:hypothetical protein n=1 Tax=Marinicauda sp. Alg238-R41 TaxID=2993447 RepID=UPI0022E33F04|nr:hypothetical protein [Marinicauda sp. Alg238-R41]
MTKMRVAKGRTLQLARNDNKDDFAGEKDIVELEVEEAKRLKGLGFVVDYEEPKKETVKSAGSKKAGAAKTGTAKTGSKTGTAKTGTAKTGDGDGDGPGDSDADDASGDETPGSGQTQPAA